MVLRTQWIGSSRLLTGSPHRTINVSETRFNLLRMAESVFGVVYDGMTDENLRVVERFTRKSADMILYQATVEDPTVYTKPWTVEIAMNKTGEPIYEYACHEGNYGMSGILSGIRAEEKKAALKGPAGR